MTNYRRLCAELVAAWDDLPWQYNRKGDIIGVKGLPPDDSAVERARVALAERPNRLSTGDVWEFSAEVLPKGKAKPVNKLLQWEVLLWHSFLEMRELQSLDGEHTIYVEEDAPCYNEEMRFIRSSETKTQKSNQPEHHD